MNSDAITAFKHPTIIPPNNRILEKSVPRLSLASNPTNIATTDVAPIRKKGYIIPIINFS